MLRSNASESARFHRALVTNDLRGRAEFPPGNQQSAREVEATAPAHGATHRRRAYESGILKDMRTPSLRFLKTFQIAAKRGSFRAAAIFFASELLLPRLAGFSAVHGDIDIQIATGITPNEEHASDADVSIVVGTGDWTDVPATRLFPQTYVLACSPELLRHSSIRSIPRPRWCMRPSVASALRWCPCRCRRRGFRPAR